jgi:hypothetical protein
MPTYFVNEYFLQLVKKPKRIDYSINEVEETR